MKKKLLISWSNPYQFYNFVVPLVPQLAEEFSVYVILMNYRIPMQLCEWLESMLEKKLIVQYWQLPDYWESMSFSCMLKHHRYIRQHLGTWKACDFDVWLASDDFLSFQKYLCQCVISEQCVHLCWIWGRTHLLIQEDLVKALLSSKNVQEVMTQYKQRWQEAHRFLKRLQNWVAKAEREKSLKEIWKKGKHVLRQEMKKVRRRWIDFADRVLLPWIFVGRIFPYDPSDWWTQTGPGNCDAMIFCDEVVAKAHAPLYKKPSIYIASYPTEGLCRCGGVPKDKSAILVLVGHGHELRANFLKLYERDVRTVLSQTGAQSVHLRQHPRTTGDAQARLNRYLNDRGIRAIPVGNEQPIWAIVCDYLAVVGPLSDALRDARAACDYVCVACFIAVSDPRYKNPRFSFGDSKMIDWIETDGSYDPDIFVRRKHEKPRRKTVPEILLELTRRATLHPHARDGR